MKIKDYENYTFESLGFRGVKPIIWPKAPKGNRHYNTIGINHPRDNIVHYLADQIIDYASRKRYGSLEGKFLSGIAYMQDGSVVFVYNGIDNPNKLSSRFMKEDYYKTAMVSEGVRVNNNMEYLAKLVNSRYPEALCILQEIPSPNPSMYHFRIVHTEESDVCNGNIIEFPKK